MLYAGPSPKMSALTRRTLLLVLLWAGCATPPSPESVAIPRAGERVDLKLGKLFIPEGFRPGEKVDILVHFHGSAKVVEREFAKAKRGGILVSIHVGAGSSVYSRAMQDPDALKGVLDDALSRFPGSKTGRISLSSFSAGYGAIREVLKHGRQEIGWIHLADSLHAGYQDGKPDAAQMEPFVRYAKSGKPMWITHSTIVPGTYASTTETADHLIAALEASREKVDEKNARGMRLVTKADRGDFHVRGYEGATGDAHLDYLHDLGEFFAKLP